MIFYSRPLSGLLSYSIILILKNYFHSLTAMQATPQPKLQFFYIKLSQKRIIYVFINICGYKNLLFFWIFAEIFRNLTKQPFLGERDCLVKSEIHLNVHFGSVFLGYGLFLFSKMDWIPIAENLNEPHKSKVFNRILENMNKTIIF